MERVRRLKLVLWMLAGLGAAIAVMRLLFGLGATTHLSDATPWGIWIGFDVLSGMAMAAGGFVVAAIAYIFRREELHSISRLAVLRACLGYIGAELSLLFDLGLPWMIWHVIIYWNVHSPLFEVAWCVMLYLAVLIMEFLPVPAEEFSALARVRRVLIKIRIPLVITGVALSTMHQSSLGSLFLAVPYYLHPLWYSPILPLLFFISAIGIGMMMVLVENHAIAYLYRRQPPSAALDEIASWARWVLLLYLAVRFGDLAVRGQLHHLIIREWPVAIFWLEIALIGVAPIVLSFIPVARISRTGQWAIGLTSVAGIVLNRVNVGGMMQVVRGGSRYFPEWTEIAISAGAVAAVILVFLFTVERFKVWEDRPADPDADPRKLPEFDKVSTTWLGVPSVAARTMYSISFIGAAALGFALLSGQPAASRGIQPAPAHRARGGNVLWIDGNLDGYGVAFHHDKHEKREGGKTSCVKCHHMNFPRDKDTGCWECHADMYQPTDAFRHDWHASPAGARIACFECHPKGKPRAAEGAKKCDQCHKDLIPPGATIQIKNYEAIGYVDSLHRLCIGCHVKKAKEKHKPEMARCTWCHKEKRSFVDTKNLPLYRQPPVGVRIVLPPVLK